MRLAQSRRSDERTTAGFTLTEVIIAMFILSVVAIVLNTALLSFIRSNTASRDISKATALGNQVLESLRMQRFDDLVDLGFDSDSVEGKYYRYWTVEPEDDGSRATITVSVSWPLATVNHSIDLSTIVSRK